MYTMTHDSSRKHTKSLLVKRDNYDWTEEYINLFEHRFPTLFMDRKIRLSNDDILYISHITNNVIAELVPDSVAMKAICFRPMRLFDKIGTKDSCLTKQDKISASNICHRHLLYSILKFVEITNCTHIYAEMSKRILSSLRTGNTILNEIFKRLSQCDQMTSFILIVDLEDKVHNGKEFYVRFIKQNYESYIKSLERRELMIKNLSLYHHDNFTCYNCHPSWLGVTAYTLQKNVPNFRWGVIPDSMTKMVTKRHNYSPRFIVDALSELFHHPDIMRTYKGIIRTLKNELVDFTLPDLYNKIYEFQVKQIETYRYKKKFLPSFGQLKVQSEPCFYRNGNKSITVMS